MPSVPDSADVAGDLLRGARRLADLSQRELAEKAGTSRRVVERIESGETAGPRPSTVVTLLAAADCRLGLQRGAPAVDKQTGITDRAGRLYPAHLDVRPVDYFGTWWGDWAPLSTLVRSHWHLAPPPTAEAHLRPLPLESRPATPATRSG